MADKPKLTRAERKQIEAVIRKYRGDGKPHTAQDTIPYQIMYPDGICYLGNRRYSQSIEFFDINYLLAQPDDQTAIFEYLCDLYNYLDSSIHVQFTYPNRKSDREQLARSFEMPPCNDGLDPIRQEQTDILKRQLASGNNGIVKTKYLTFTIEADSLKTARAPQNNESFNLINNMEFLNDRYASLNLSYDMNGKLFNRIPLIKKLKWREMFRIRGLWGTLTDKNNPYKSNNPDLFLFPMRDGVPTSHVMGKTPYVEASVGIYNIFKLLHIEYVRRLTYTDIPGVKKGGIRFMILMIF